MKPSIRSFLIAAVVSIALLFGGASLADDACDDACAEQEDACYTNCESADDAGLCEDRCSDAASDCYEGCDD